MARVGWALAAFLAATLVACGGSDGTQRDGVHDGPGDSGGGPPPPAPPIGGAEGEGCGGEVTLRLRGVAAGDLAAFALTLGSVEASAGAPLPLAQPLPPGAIDLVRDHAYRLGVVTPPAGASAVQVTVPVVAASAAGLDGIDVCTPPITFAFDPSRVDPSRCHAVVELDLARSLQAGAPGGAALLPHFTVRY